MSDARVAFHDMGHELAVPGTERRFSFRCPKSVGERCAGLLIRGATEIKHDPTGKNGRPQWEWDGRRDNPTFSPSINCEGCWHGYIENGRCVSTGKTDEPEPT